MSSDDKLATVNIQKFLSAIPTEQCSQFLAAIGSNEFLQTFADHSHDSDDIRVKFEHGSTTSMHTTAQVDHEDVGYQDFIASQMDASKESYKRYMHNYSAKNCFAGIKIPLQTFLSGFQVTSAPHLGNEAIKKEILCKDDHGNSPIA